MPGRFRANGWGVVPDPVDDRTRGPRADGRPSLDIGRNWLRLDIAAHEWIGLLVYAATGRTKSPLPMP